MLPPSEAQGIELALWESWIECQDSGSTGIYVLQHTIAALGAMGRLAGDQSKEWLRRAWQCPEVLFNDGEHDGGRCWCAYCGIVAYSHPDCDYRHKTRAEADACPGLEMPTTAGLHIYVVEPNIDGAPIEVQVYP